ncbi:MAG: hypothetical protein AAFQ98_06255, partial [Bacteroidota bacterium]
PQSKKDLATRHFGLSSIFQDQYRVEVRIREQAWGHQEIYKDPSQLIPLPSLGIELPLAELYRRVSWVVK